MLSEKDRLLSPETTAPDDVRSPTSDVAATVRAILARYLGRSVDEVPLAARLEHDLELDSFSMIEITLALEEALCFSMGDAADPLDLNLVTVGDLAAYVGRRLAAQGPGEASHAGPHDR